MQILVIEDDPTVQTLIKILLERDEYQVELAGTARKGRSLALQDNHDMIILDLGLPDGDGFELCKEIRDENMSTPILVLSAEQKTEIKVQCLMAGADDYLTKPFDTTELTARIGAIVRRTQGSRTREVISCGELKVNLMMRVFTVKGHEVELTNNEFELLVYLLQRKDETVSQGEIAKDVWDIHFDTQTNYINVYISYLRKKIRAHADRHYINTVRKKGFVINCS